MSFDRATVAGGALRVQSGHEQPQKPATRVSSGICACGRTIVRTRPRGPLPKRCDSCRSLADVRAILRSAYRVAATHTVRGDLCAAIVDAIALTETR